nr:D175 [uncultured bacterium]
MLHHLADELEIRRGVLVYAADVVMAPLSAASMSNHVT